MFGSRSFSSIEVGVALAILLVAAQGANAQVRSRIQAGLTIPEADQVQIVQLDGGLKYIGRIAEIRERDILFVTDLGELVIPADRIRSIRLVPATSIRAGRYWFPNPNSTRLILSPTARMLKKGQGFFADYLLFFPSVSFGVSDHFTIGGGMSLFPGLGVDQQIFLLSPKVGLLNSKNLQLAAGALFLGSPIFPSEIGTIGLAYGVGTLGSAETNLNLGLGFGFAGGVVARRPVAMIGGQARVSRRIALVSENWFFPGLDRPIVSYGIRFLGQRLSVNLSFLTVPGEGALFPGIPLVDFVAGF